jgi:hypothetical protein
VEGLNETPVIEFCAGTFSRPLTMTDLVEREAGREVENPYPAGACTR